MSTPTKSEYMLLFRGTDWHKGLSPQEIQQVVNQMKAWFDRLTAEAPRPGNHCSTKARLFHRKEAARVRRCFPNLETVGGFFLLEVRSLDEAAEIAKDFPALEYGATVEVRPVAPECMVGETAQQRSEREARLRASA